MSRTDRAPAPQPSTHSKPSPRGRVAAFALSLALALLAGAAAARPAWAIGGGPCTMEILVDGRPIPEYVARGGWYVEALAGREYAVRLTNRSDRRIAVALSVDGLNSIDAKTTTAADATKWIIDPWQSITIDGWQTSAQAARKFFFTTESRSYGSWLGKTRNLGIIGAAVFRERAPQPRPWCGDREPCPYGRLNDEKKDQRRRGGRPLQSPTAPEDAPPPAAEAPSAKSEADSGDAGDELRSLGYIDSRAPGSERQKESSRKQRADDLAATGIGREIGHPVVRVPFDAEPGPATVMEVRYEYRDALVRLGVFPPCAEPGCDDRLARREGARPFTDRDFAPDPYRRDRR